MLLFYETEIPKIPLRSILDNGYSIHDFPTPGETRKRTSNIQNVKCKMQQDAIALISEMYIFHLRQKRETD